MLQSEPDSFIQCYTIPPPESDLKLCALLQALRWRIISSKMRLFRVGVIAEYVRQDLLGSNTGCVVIEKILKHENRRVAEYLVALIDEIAGEGIGGRIASITQVLVIEPLDSILMKKTLGAIEKCSVRRNAQSTLVKLGLIQWILGVLKNSKNLQISTLEYSTALLMNMALHSQGRKICQDPSLEIMKILIPLLKIDNENIRTHINGTMYSIMTTAAIKEAAKSAGLPEVFASLLHSVNEGMVRQIQYTQAKLEKKEDESECNSDSDEESIDIDENEECSDQEEMEIDQEIVTRGISIGESLLMNEFGLNGEPINLEESAQIENREFASIPDALAESLSEMSKPLEDPRLPHVKQSLPFPLIESEHRLSTPQIHKEYSANNQSNYSEASKRSDRRVPSAMQSRPKIPRTPIPIEHLEKAKKENEEFKKNAVHIHRNEEANRKKRKIKEQNSSRHMKSEEFQKGDSDIVPTGYGKSMIVNKVVSITDGN